MKIIQIAANDKIIVGLGDDGVLYVRQKVLTPNGRRYMWVQDLTNNDVISRQAVEALEAKEKA